MIKVSVRNGMTPTTIIVDENNTTVKQAFQQAGASYEGYKVCLSGSMLNEDELDELFADLTDKDAVTLSIVTKTDNAANVIVADKAVILRSELTYGNIKTLAAKKPDALTVKDENGEPVFKVSADGVAAISRYGITFRNSENDSEPASITVFPNGDPMKFALEVAGPAVLKLEQIELAAPDALTELAAEDDLIRSKITTV